MESFDYVIRVNDEVWGWVDGKENAERIIDDAARELIENGEELFIKREVEKPDEILVMKPGRWFSFSNYVEYRVFYEPIYYIIPGEKKDNNDKKETKEK